MTLFSTSKYILCILLTFSGLIASDNMEDVQDLTMTRSMWTDDLYFPPIDQYPLHTLVTQISAQPQDLTVEQASKVSHLACSVRTDTKKAEINKRKDEKTPLDIAIASDNPKKSVVNLLLSLNARCGKDQWCYVVAKQDIVNVVIAAGIYPKFTYDYAHNNSDSASRPFNQVRQIRYNTIMPILLATVRVRPLCEIVWSYSEPTFEEQTALWHAKEESKKGKPGLYNSFGHKGE